MPNVNALIDPTANPFRFSGMDFYHGEERSMYDPDHVPRNRPPKTEVGLWFVELTNDGRVSHVRLSESNHADGHRITNKDIPPPYTTALTGAHRWWGEAIGRRQAIQLARDSFDVRVRH